LNEAAAPAVELERRERIMKTALATLAMSAILLANAGRARADDTKGHLEIKSDPSAEIFIDGADMHLMTPQTLDLAPGHHTLELKVGDGRQSKIGFTVTGGKTTKLKMQPR
jgi:hypothetical protein